MPPPSPPFFGAMVERGGGKIGGSIQTCQEKEEVYTKSRKSFALEAPRADIVNLLFMRQLLDKALSLPQSQAGWRFWRASESWFAGQSLANRKPRMVTRKLSSPFETLMAFHDSK